MDEFTVRLCTDLPPLARILSLETQQLEPVGFKGFEIRHSEQDGSPSALILPDIAICSDCRRELFDPIDRRYLYPFINCTNCGPRYSIILRLPYDRQNTTMNRFRMCSECQNEYDNPTSRRFHAQPNACPVCGPTVELWDASGNSLALSSEAIMAGVDLLKKGFIVAVKGLGGFHLMVDALNDVAVKRLRQQKRREAKPLAVMFPNLMMLKDNCEVELLEERLLTSPESPIVLVQRKANCNVAESIAPGNPYIGALLPYTPLHLILMHFLGSPVVATSGNLTDEPICIDEYEALKRLGGIADYFLVHNRPIARYVDDSIARVILGREQILRRARGYAPLPLRSCKNLPTILALGGHLKNTVALSIGKEIFISHHIGDLENSEATEAFEKVVKDFSELWDADIKEVACDLHPDYFSTRYAEHFDKPIIKVQHHLAHSLACLLENEIEPPVLAVSWDGTGYGLDGAIWGGEFLKIDEKDFERFAFLKPFTLPGGDQAVREPCRSALGILYALYGDMAFSRMDLPTLKAFDRDKLKIVAQLLKKQVNSPLTTSAGRLFDAVASLIDIRQHSRFEGEAAMALEFAAHNFKSDKENLKYGNFSYDFKLVEVDKLIPLKSKYPAFLVDWSPVIVQIIDDIKRGINISQIAYLFHLGLAEIIVKVAEQCGLERVLLTGGCFQNRMLTELGVEGLRKAGFKPYWHQRVPPGDGGIALGQIKFAELYNEVLKNR